jgi:OmpA-OmpF porin, OOP family
MKIAYILLAASIAVATAGCTTSGPTYNLDAVQLSNGSQAYRVQCQGLFESSKQCMSQINKVCENKGYHLLSSVDHAVSGFKPENDPREYTFACGPAQAPVAQQPAPQPVAPVPAPISQARLVLPGDANFAVNSAVLSPVAKEQLDRFMSVNSGVKIKNLVISGYTDSTGSDALNLKLSDARARSTQSYLVSHGLQADNFSVRGYGKQSPVASNATAEGRAKNRRVEIEIVNN